MNYACFDDTGTMHVYDSEKTAKYAARFNGKVKPYGGGCRGGYPLYEGNEIIVTYAGGSFKVVHAHRGGDVSVSKDVEDRFVEFARGLV